MVESRYAILLELVALHEMCPSLQKPPIHRKIITFRTGQHIPAISCLVSIGFILLEVTMVYTLASSTFLSAYSVRVVTKEAFIFNVLQVQSKKPEMETELMIHQECFAMAAKSFFCEKD